MESIRDKGPKWESKFWSYLSTGDGMHCPLYKNCHVRKRKDDWCGDDHRDKVGRLFDGDGEFDVNKYDCIKYSKHFNSWGLFRFVQRLADRHIKKANVSSPPIPSEFVFKILEGCNVTIQQLPLKSCHGALWFDGRWIIQLRDGDSSGVKRVTMFHEVFHILAHNRVHPVFRKAGSEQGYFNELLADYFAVCSLIPRLWLEKEWAKTKDLVMMAKIFDVPKSVIWFRLRESGHL